MSDIELLLNARDRFFKRTLVAGGLSLLLAAASRLPTWEVAAPVEWLLGTVNVGFVPIFGPIIIFGCYCFAIAGLNEVIAVQRALLSSPKLTAVEQAILHHGAVGPARDVAPRERIVNYALRVWVFGVPLIAYGILLVTYLDFVRPSEKNPDEAMFPTHRERVVDILLGTGGWGSFRPLTPTIVDNLNKRAAAADKNEERERLRRVADFIPYIHAPLQAWGYILGALLMIYMAGEELLGRFWRGGAERLAKWRARRKQPPTAADSENLTIPAGS